MGSGTFIHSFIHLLIPSVSKSLCSPWPVLTRVVTQGHTPDVHSALIELIVIGTNKDIIAQKSKSSDRVIK